MHRDGGERIMVLNDRGDLVSEAEPAVLGDRHVRPAALALFVLIHGCVVLSIAMVSAVSAACAGRDGAVSVCRWSRSCRPVRVRETVQPHP